METDEFIILYTAWVDTLIKKICKTTSDAYTLPL